MVDFTRIVGRGYGPNGDRGDEKHLPKETPAPSAPSAKAPSIAREASASTPKLSSTSSLLLQGLFGDPREEKNELIPPIFSPRLGTLFGVEEAPDGDKNHG